MSRNGFPSIRISRVGPAPLEQAVPKQAKSPRGVSRTLTACAGWKMHCNRVSGQSRTLDRPASFIWLVIPGENEMSKAASLEYTDRFVSRHIGPNEAEVRDMLQTIGYDS